MDADRHLRAVLHCVRETIKLDKEIMNLAMLCTFLGYALLAPTAFADEGFDSPLNLKQVEQIDWLVEKRLKDIKQKSNPVASEEVLLRRLYLQIIGRNPTVREFEDYLGMTPNGNNS